MQQIGQSILRRLGKALHIYVDDITYEPLPRRWVDLIHHLDEQERSREHRPKSRANRSDAPSQ